MSKKKQYKMDKTSRILLAALITMALIAIVLGVLLWKANSKNNESAGKGPAATVTPTTEAEPTETKKPTATEAADPTPTDRAEPTPTEIAAITPTGEVTPEVPASILQLHGDVTLVADEAALSEME